jgi:hypothetical protein
LAYKISYRKISEINVKAKFCGFHFHGKFCSENPILKEPWSKSRFCWEIRNGSRKNLDFCGFDVHFASFSVWNLAFLRNVRAYHFCCMWILTTTAFHSPKVHFHGGNADIFPLWKIEFHSKQFVDQFHSIPPQSEVKLTKLHIGNWMEWILDWRVTLLHEFFGLSTVVTENTKFWTEITKYWAGNPKFCDWSSKFRAKIWSFG